jgi:hypothetical protein
MALTHQDNGIAGHRMPRLSFLLPIGFSMLGLAQTSLAGISFSETSTEAGIVYSGESYGASWGDLNGDGLPDLFINRHRNNTALYVNNGNGTFTDIGPSVDIWTSDPYVDMHGGSWNDFDNDGDDDLYIATGRVDLNQFFVNQGGTLINETATYNPTVDLWRARMPIFFDFNDDGFLGFLMTSGENVGDTGPSPNLVFEQVGGNFVDVTPDTGLACFSAQMGILVDVGGDDRLELLCGFGSFPEGVYETSTLPFGDLTATMPVTGAVQDVAIGDFDGNGKMDLFMVRGSTRITEGVKTGPTSVEAQVIANGKSERGFRFDSNGDLTVSLATQTVKRTEIFIGANGLTPASLPFTVSSNDSSTWGLADRDPASDKGLYIGYDPATGQWEFRVSPGRSWIYTWVGIESTASVSEVTTFGLGAGDRPIAPVLLMQTENGWVDRTAFAGLSEPVQCIAAAAADFDNDMDTDIYMVCRQGLSNLRNRLFENNGNGVFTEVAGAGGAQGAVGPGNAGAGENVVIADYDMDGFLDLFVTNGLNMQPPGKGGPDQLFRNTSGDHGNTNNWIQLDLVGTVSNRDAVGAKVFVTAGGKTQVREQNGGYHRWAQHHQRIHFGLGSNDFADVKILWPSGEVQTLTGLAAGTLYEIVESSAIVVGVADVAVDEGDAVASVTITLSSPAAGGSVFVDYATVDGSATAGLDYLATSGIAEIAAGESSTSFEVPLIEDGLAEGNETFSVTLSNLVTPPGFGAILGSSTATVTIVDNDADVCGQPNYDPSSDIGLYLWRDCAVSGPDAQWNLRVTAGGSSSAVRYRGTVTATSGALSASGFSLESGDTLDSTPGDGMVDYDLRLIGSGQDGFRLAVPAGVDACVDPSDLPAGAGVYVGSTSRQISGAFALSTLGPCDDTPPIDNASAACGAPAFDPGSDQGVFVWRECAVTGADESWQVRITGGGSAWMNYAGAITSDALLTTVGFSLEASDSLDANSSGDGDIDYSLFVGGRGVDGFQLTVPSGATTCFDPAVLPAGAGVYVGSTSRQISGAFALSTLGACDDTPPIDNASAACGAPTYDPTAEPGLYLWRDCDAPDSGTVWQVRASAGGSDSNVRYMGSILSGPGDLAVTGVSLENSDELAIDPVTGVLEYVLKLRGVGQDGFRLDVAADATACLESHELPAGAEVYLGAGKAVMNGAFDLATLGNCTL